MLISLLPADIINYLERFFEINQIIALRSTCRRFRYFGFQMLQVKRFRRCARENVDWDILTYPAISRDDIELYKILKELIGFTMFTVEGTRDDLVYALLCKSTKCLKYSKLINCLPGIDIIEGIDCFLRDWRSAYGEHDHTFALDWLTKNGYELKAETKLSLNIPFEEKLKELIHVKDKTRILDHCFWQFLPWNLPLVDHLLASGTSWNRKIERWLGDIEDRETLEEAQRILHKYNLDGYRSIKARRDVPLKYTPPDYIYFAALKGDLKYQKYLDYLIGKPDRAAAVHYLLRLFPELDESLEKDEDYQIVKMALENKIDKDIMTKILIERYHAEGNYVLFIAQKLGGIEFIRNILKQNKWINLWCMFKTLIKLKIPITLEYQDFKHGFRYLDHDVDDHDWIYSDLIAIQYFVVTNHSKLLDILISLNLPYILIYFAYLLGARPSEELKEEAKSILQYPDLLSEAGIWDYDGSILSYMKYRKEMLGLDCYPEKMQRVLRIFRRWTLN